MSSTRSIEYFRLLSRLKLFQPVCLRCHIYRRTLSQDSNAIMTIQQVRDNMKDILGAQKFYSKDPSAPSKPAIDASTIESQNALPSRRIADSENESYIELSQDDVREKYLTWLKTIRFGRILEDLDTFAVWTSFKHNSQPWRKISCVTALVDRIEMRGVLQTLRNDADIKMKGRVTWAGTSSMEVTMNLQQEHSTNNWVDFLEAKFLMVARDPVRQRKAFVNPLVPEGEEEQKLYDLGAKCNAARHQTKIQALDKTPPNEEEVKIVHDFFLQTLDPGQTTFKVRVLPPNSTWMENALLKSVILCQPEERNLYNKIFGGFLMRKAYEVGWMNAYTYSKSLPLITTAVDDISFQRSVELGSLLFLSSQVVYTNGPHMQIKVRAEVFDPVSGTRFTTNTFHFTLSATNGPVPSVVPKTYAEAMLYLDGKRHYEAKQ